MIRPALVAALLMAAATVAKADGTDTQPIENALISDLGTVMDPIDELESVRAFGDDDVDFNEVPIPGTGLTLEDLNLGIGILNGSVHTLASDPGLANAPPPSIMGIVTPRISTRSKSF